jgi:hypothetical protein
MMKFQVARVSVSPKVATRLGELTIAWSQLEFQIQCALWDVSEIDSRIGRIFTHRAGMEKWLDLMLRIVNARYADKQARDDWQRAAQLVRQAQSERNSLTHPLWSHKVAPGNMRIQKAVNKGRKSSKTIAFEPAEISSKDIKATIENTYAAIEAVVAWQCEYIYGPIGEKSPTLPPLP